MAKLFGVFSTLLVALFVLDQTSQADAWRFRCGVLSFLGNDRACRAYCFASGQKTGELTGLSCC